jgi:hypothetical protein
MNRFPQLLVCEAGRAQDTGNTSRFIEPDSATSWSFDHLRLVGSDPIPVNIDSACETIRKELSEAALKYGQEFFSEGVSKVFTTQQTKLVKPKQAADVPVREDETEAEEVKKEDEEMAAAAGAEVAEEVGETAQVSSEEVPPVAEAQATAAAESQEDSEMTSAPTPAADQGEDMAEADQAETAEPSNEPVAATTEPKAEETKEEEIEEIQEPLQKKFSLYFVGNKYNPSNYW